MSVKRGKKGIHSNVRNQKETAMYGKRKVLNRHLNGLSEKEYRALFKNHPKLSIIKALHEYSNEKNRFHRDILEGLCGFKGRTIKGNMEDLTKRGIFKNLIKVTYSPKRTKLATYKNQWYFDDTYPFRDKTFKEVMDLYLFDRYKLKSSNPKSRLDPNKSEEFLMECCDEVLTGEPYYNGSCMGKKIGGYRPDILLYNFKDVLIENFGPYHYNVTKFEDEKNRLKKLLFKNKKRIFIVFESEKIDKEYIKERFIEFMECNFKVSIIGCQKKYVINAITPKEIKEGNFKCHLEHSTVGYSMEVETVNFLNQEQMIAVR